MTIRNSATRYGTVTIFLHWFMAILIIGLLILGLYMVDLPINLKKLKLYGWHKELGILVLMLAILRVLWRLSTITPILPTHLADWQKRAAHGMHFLLYVSMFVMPLSGWMLSSAADLPVSFFGLFVLPNLIAPNEQVRVLLTTVHHWWGFSLIILICGHIGAALLHHFIYKDDILKRILPSYPRRSKP